MQTILWRDVRSGGVERAVLASDAAGFHLAGTALFAVDGAPMEVRYSVLTDAEWRTRVVGVHVQAAGVNHRIALKSDGDGEWTAGDEPQPGLSGAVDVDLSFSPATNMLPINRLELAVGAAAEISVAMVDPVRRRLMRATQTYERMAELRYRYAAGDFTTELTVDEHGFVVAYPEIFETLAGPWVGSPA